MKATRMVRRLLLLLGFSGIILGGCTRNDTLLGGNHVTGSGILASSTPAVGHFEGVRIENQGNVTITPDSVDAVRIEADDNVLPLVKIRVENGILVVGLPEGSYNNVTMNIAVSMRVVHSLESYGAAQFRTVKPLHTDFLSCHIAGAGGIELTGTADEETVRIEGAGSVHNFGLVARRCSASIAGAGEIEVYASQALHATIEGTGSITYDGNPPQVDQSIAGVGKIRKRN